MSLFPKIDFTLSDHKIDSLYKTQAVKLVLDESDYDENQPVVVKSPDGSKSALCFFREGEVRLAKKTDIKVQGVSPKDARQKLFMSTLYSDQILMSVCAGRAGTGKTLLSVAYALERYFKAEKNIILIKPTTFIGGKSNLMAPVPGSVHEKLEPIMGSYMAHFKTLLGRDAEHFIYEMLEKGRLEFLPVETARGRNLQDAVVIIDEAQNLDVHSLKSLISRVHESSKLIVLGDLKQVDTASRYKETGLFMLLDSDVFRESLYTSMIELKTQYRSPLADLAESWTDELDSRLTLFEEF